MEKKNLPTLQEIYKGDLATMKSHNDLNILLGSKPKEDWIKEHPIIKVEREVNGAKVKTPLQYLTIERVEYLLTSIFGRWRVEVKEVKLLANSVIVTIRLFYWNPIAQDWDFQDGIGAAPLQTDKDFGAVDFDHIKSDAVQKGAPAAESFAVKDAAHKIGKIFGKELNRRDEIDYQSNLSKKFETKIDLQRKISQVLDEIGDEAIRDHTMSEMMEAESEGRDDYEFYLNILNNLTNADRQ